jgi:hypothetical protein
LIHDFTPFGFLRNPFARASSWTQCEGGSLRTSEEVVGVEWTYPWYRDPAAGAGLCLVAWIDDALCQSRSDFGAVGYTSRQHTANVKGFDWFLGQVEVSARFFLVDDSLCLSVTVCHRGLTPHSLRLGLVTRGWTRAGEVAVDLAPDTVRMLTDLGGPGPACHAVALAGWGAPGPVTDSSVTHALAIAEAELRLEPSSEMTLVGALARHDHPTLAAEGARLALEAAPTRLAELAAADTAFAAGCPTLSGDWPRAWAEGLHYDFQSTRLLVMPRSGIFTDVWPAWMVAWPRVVLAEGVLDMARLGYADPALAQRAVLTLFRDAPAPNIPCVFYEGSYNMVARDGSRCGTSPAWCLPFLNLELLYLRQLDRDWLATLYPYLAGYLDWWLVERIHADGWVVYKCTWEAGEDGNPRLDPSGSGDADISGHCAPVELQASVAHAADVLAFFADQLGLGAERRRWRSVRDTYRGRTRELFDAEAGRFRDWLLLDRRFQEPRPTEHYWGVDSRRFSPLSLTPLLGGTATADQARALRDEVPAHATAPWTLWPSWCYALAECAAAAGMHELAGEIVAGVVDRVYQWTARRTLSDGARPTPGAAPEYWPMDWRGYTASDAYGWGATTANLLLRHLFGLQESRTTRGWVLELVPALPAAWLESGCCYRVRRFQYRGRLVDVAYTVEARWLDVQVDLETAARCTVTAARSVVYRADAPAARHRFRLRNGRRYRLEISAA